MKNNKPARQDILDTRKTLETLRFLSQKIGGRGSCTLQERKAGDYIADQLRTLGVGDVRSETFQAIPSTYWPFAVAFAAALTGSLLVLALGGRDVLILALILNALGVWGMLAETEFAPSWVRWVLPRQPSLNVSGSIASKGDLRQRVVLCAHLDTHRTPVFYSSSRWYALFGLLVGLAFLSMAAGTLVYGAAVALAWSDYRWASLVLIPIQAVSLLACLQAEFTPYTPGANDNASGVAAVLTLGKRLTRNPLKNTEVHLVFTGCEEVGAQGMAAYLDQHASQLGPEALYVIMDEVGAGTLKFLTSDGLLLKHKTHRQALEIARHTAQTLAGIKVLEGPGLAYTDALQATKRGLVALTLCAVPTPESGLESHWHQVSDTLENLQLEDLEKAMAFAWALLQQVDRPAEGAPQPLSG